MIIRFNRIKMIGFLSIGEAELVLDNRGITLVSGTNNYSPDGAKSNGAGKSSFIDAISWVLTGSTIRGTTDVVNINYPENYTRVELEFTVDSNRYLLIRTKNDPEYGNNLKIFYNDDDISGKGIKESNMILSTHLPYMTSKLIGSIIILGQGMPTRFTSYSPAGRKDLLEELTNSSEFIDKLKGQLSTRKSLLDSKRQEIELSVMRLTGNIESNNKLVDSLLVDKSVSDTDLDSNINKLNDDISNYQKMITEGKDRIDQYDDKIRQLSGYIDQYNTIKQSLVLSRSSLMNERNSYASNECPTCHRPYDRIVDPKIISNYDDRIYDINSKIDRIDEEISNYNSSINNLRSLINDIPISTYEGNMTSAKILLSKYESTKNQLSDIDNKILLLRLNNNELGNKIIELEASKAKIDKYLSIISELSSVASKEFRGYLLQSVLNYLEDRSRHYSDILFNTRSVDIRLSGTRIDISYSNKSYDNLSGGERQKIDLCIQFALRDMMVTLVGFSCNILCLDEAFDNLDTDGCQKLLNLIINEFSDLESIFIITHHTDIPIPYDNIINVIKNTVGVSSIHDGLLN